MTTKYFNPAVLRNLRVADDAGDVTCNIFVFDFADKSYAPATLGVGDSIQIGTIPAGEKLLPHLSRLDLPAVDTNGTPTGTFTGGTASSAAALLASHAAQTAATIVGAGFALSTGEVGDANVDTPILLTMTAAVATVAATGKIGFEQFSRPIRCDAPDNAVVG